MTDTERMIREQLYQLRDPDYRAFQSALLPTVPRERIIGVRVPALRRLARQMMRDGSGIPYLQSCSLPHQTYDEDNLHAFLIEGISDFDVCLAESERFLPYVDNWATCDMMAPKVLGTEPARLFDAVRGWLSSDAEFTVRYGIVTLMRYYLGEHFSPEIFALVSSVSHDGYYVRMAAAWFLAEALAVRWDDAYPALTSAAFPLPTRKKAIQKALESRKLTEEQKTILRKMRGEMSQ